MSYMVTKTKANVTLLLRLMLSFHSVQCNMCRYIDVSRIKWKNIKFESDSSSFEITFEIRKNVQFRQRNKGIVSATINKEICTLKLSRALQNFSNQEGGDFIFRGFNARLVAKNPGKTTPMKMAIKYAQYMRCLSFWF